MKKFSVPAVLVIASIIIMVITFALYLSLDGMAADMVMVFGSLSIIPLLGVSGLIKSTSILKN